MDSKLTGLALISLLVLTGSQSASAQGQGRGARFNYAPNVFSLEGPVMPKAVQAAHSVRSGSVPRGSNFLGVDPQFLAKPVAPPVTQTLVTAAPAVNQAAGQLLPKIPFNNSFGKPASAAPPVIAQAPVPAAAPMAALAKSLPPVTAAKPVTSSRPAGGHHRRLRSNKDVHGVLTKRPQTSPDGLQATAGRGLDSYGKNVGYVPGPFLPASTGDGMRTEANVSGRIIR